MAAKKITLIRKVEVVYDLTYDTFVAYMGNRSKEEIAAYWKRLTTDPDAVKNWTMGAKLVPNDSVIEVEDGEFNEGYEDYDYFADFIDELRDGIDEEECEKEDAEKEREEEEEEEEKEEEVE